MSLSLQHLLVRKKNEEKAFLLEWVQYLAFGAYCPALIESTKEKDKEMRIRIIHS
jgi:hypothetical protein